MTLPSNAIPLIVTSAITINASRTRLTASHERLRLTLEALKVWMTISAFPRIVVCDGSGFDMAPHLQQLSEQGNRNVAFESLCFHNDSAMVAKLGKGYGEGQIVQHAITHSRFVAEAADSFAKCTSKLWVTNAVDCLRYYNGTAALNLSGGFVPKQVDTRFYICSKAFYEAHLRDCHLTVDEDRGRYLEHRFLEAIRGTRMFRNTLFPTPRILGVSGSMGTEYRSSWKNNLVKDFRNTALGLVGR